MVLAGLQMNVPAMYVDYVGSWVLKGFPKKLLPNCNQTRPQRRGSRVTFFNGEAVPHPSLNHSLELKMSIHSASVTAWVSKKHDGSLASGLPKNAQTSVIQRNEIIPSQSKRSSGVAEFWQQ